MNLHEYITFPLLETALISIPLSGAGSWSPCLPRWRYQGSSFSSVSLLLLPRFSLSLGPGSALGGKGKSNRRGEKNRRFASLAGIFPISPRFSVFAFYELPLCEAWSQATLPFVLFFSFFFFFSLSRWPPRSYTVESRSITKCQGTEKIVRYSGIAKTPL